MHLTRLSSPYFITDADGMEAVMEDPLILIHDKKISSMKDLLPVLEKGCADGQAVAHYRRRRRGRSAGHAGCQQTSRHFESVRVKAPGFGDRRKALH
jgi:chaperonin GroEL